MIFIRVDANRHIGLGHMMRCLSIATQLRALSEEVCFVLADDSAKELLESRGQAYLVLGTDYRQMDRELQALIPLVREYKPKFLLADSYFATEEYFEKLSAETKVVYLDDRASFPCSADALINYNIYADIADYQRIKDRSKKYLLGLDYVPLRKEFCEVSYEVQPEAEHVLITTGGADRYNLAGQILLKSLSEPQIDKLHYHVVSGVFNEHLPMLEELEEKYFNVHIHKNVSDMAALMKQCDLAVSAAGSTLYELCAVGVPVLCFSFADNQVPMVEGFLKRGLVCYGGHYLDKGQTLLSEVTDRIRQLVNRKEERQAFSLRQRKTVDGLGARRLAEELTETFF